MIKIILALYLFLFPRCEMMVSFLSDFRHCDDSPAHAARCFAASDWDYGGAPIALLRANPTLQAFIFRLPFVRTVSCWQ